MKLPCSIVKDLIPIYYENLVSDESKAYIDEHISECEGCKTEVDNLKQSQEPLQGKIEPDKDIAPLVKVKKKLKSKNSGVAIMSVLMSLLVGFVVFRYLNVPIPVKYDESMFSITQEFQTVKLQINGQYDIVMIESGGRSKYQNGLLMKIQISQSRLSRMLSNNSDKSFYKEIDKTITGPLSIYYETLDGSENILVYGLPDEAFENSITLARLSLSYYFIIMLIIALALGAGVIALRKSEKYYTILIKLLFVPCSYLIAQLLVKGVSFKTYILEYDLYTILLAAIIIYALLISIRAIYTKYKATKANK